MKCLDVSSSHLLSRQQGALSCVSRQQARLRARPAQCKLWRGLPAASGGDLLAQPAVLGCGPWQLPWLSGQPVHAAALCVAGDGGIGVLVAINGVLLAWLGGCWSTSGGAFGLAVRSLFAELEGWIWCVTPACGRLPGGVSLVMTRPSCQVVAYQTVLCCPDCLQTVVWTACPKMLRRLSHRDYGC